MTILESDVANNVTGDAGGGLYVEGGSINEVSDTLFAGNTADRGGAIATFEDSLLTITGTSLSNNIAHSGIGGGLAAGSGSSTQ